MRPENITGRAIKEILGPEATIDDLPSNKAIEPKEDDPVGFAEASIISLLIRVKIYEILKWPDQQKKALGNLNEKIIGQNHHTEEAVKRLKKRGVIFPPELTELEKVKTS